MGRNAIFFIQVLISQTVLGECNRGDMDVRCHTLWHTTAILELENIFVSVLERLMIRRTLSPNGVVLVKLFFSAPCFWTIIDKILNNFIAMACRLFRTTGRERRPPRDRANSVPYHPGVTVMNNLRGNKPVLKLSQKRSQSLADSRYPAKSRCCPGGFGLTQKLLCPATNLESLRLFVTNFHFWMVIELWCHLFIFWVFWEDTFDVKYLCSKARTKVVICYSKNRGTLDRWNFSHPHPIFDCKIRTCLYISGFSSA